MSFVTMNRFRLALVAFVVVVMIAPLAASATGPQQQVAFSPTRITYQNLQQAAAGTDAATNTARAVLKKALKEVGMISITDVFDGTDGEDIKDAMMRNIHGCCLSSASTRQHMYKDGTLRRTMASHSLPSSSGIQTMKHDVKNSMDDTVVVAECQEFEENSYLFREQVAAVTETVSRMISSLILEEDYKKGHSAILETTEGIIFETLSDVVEVRHSFFNLVAKDFCVVLSYPTTFLTDTIMYPLPRTENTWNTSIAMKL
jgi:hypothetical protein